MLCHPGETRTEHTLRQQFDWRGLHTTVHDVCKKCPTCQRAKTTNQKYGKLPPKQAETNPWDTLCLDLICSYMIPPKGKNPLKLWCLTMINPATGWFKMAQIPNKTAAEIADITEKTWFACYPLPQRIVFDRGTEFSHKFGTAIKHNSVWKWLTSEPSFLGYICNFCSRFIGYLCHLEPACGRIDHC